MHNWDVVTSDGDKVGHVVGEHGDYLIVEQGTIRKAKHALPRTFAHPMPDAEQICISVPKNALQDSPKVNGDFDEEAIARFWGLSSGYEEPPTEGGGSMNDDDPAWGPDQDAAAAGHLSAEKQRARIREHGRAERRPPSSPGFLGERKPPARER